jgi:flagellar hook protein FlgE
MIRSLNTGVGGIRNFQTSLDVIANNLANLNTVGFKGGRTDFAEALTQTIKPSTPDGANKSGSSSIQMANGVSTNSVTTLYTQGAVNQTGKITDMAIAGEGYFIVKEYTNKGAINNSETEDGAAPGIAEPDKAKKTTPAGIEYATRAGDFRLDSNGYLVNNSGMRVQGYSDLILEPTSVGDIKFDRGDYMSSVEVIKADDNFKLLTTNKNHGLKTGNIVVLKSDSELTAPTLADGSQVPGTLLQAGTPYYVHAISDNQIAFYDNLTNATNNDLDQALLINPPKEGVRVVKKLASYESSSVSQINNENTIFTKAAHGFKDGDKVEFYVGNSTKATAAQTVDSKTGIGDYTATPFEVDGTQGALETGDIIYFSNGAKFTLSAPAAANATQLQGRLEGGNVMAGEGATISSAASLTIDTDGVKTTVSANVDGDKSGAFTRSFFISLRGEKSFTLHSSQEDASLRVRPIKFDNLSIKDAVVTKVASSTTAEIQNISVDGAGKVNIMLTDGTQYSRGQVLLKKFTNEQALSKQGSNLYSNLQNAGGNKEWGVAGSDGYGRVEAGALELSNVDVAREFSKLITTQRAFQANSRMVSASDEILMELLRLKR